MAKVCKRALVEGRVQGVWFRGSTQEQAIKRDITGWAKNLPDGRVEVLMCGENEQVAELEQWLHQGPRLAHVTSVQIMTEGWQKYVDFTTG